VGTLAKLCFALISLNLLLALAACGGSSSPTATTNGPLTGNWQVTMLQQYPKGPLPLGISGFLVQAKDTLTGNVNGPTTISSNGQTTTCGGTAEITGSINGQSVTFSEAIGGTTYNFTGTISSDNQSMSGDFAAPAGACFTEPTTGTWNAFLIPVLNGNFTGTLMSNYEGAFLNGPTASAASVKVSGSLSQTSNAGSSAATITGTINATNYPCFSTASVSGTISGQTVFLIIYGFNGEPIGTLGQVPNTPATVSSASGNTSLVGLMNLGSSNQFGSSGPCPSIDVNGSSQTYDTAIPTTLNF
jgi:hypothetical protein